MKQSKTELIILGSGTCIPSPKRSPAGIVVKFEDNVLLFDSGSGTLNKLLHADVDYKELKYLFYTHTHADHTSDLVPILQAIRISPQFQRTESLHIFGPKQFSQFLDTLSRAYGTWITEADYDIVIEELHQEKIELPFGSIKTAPMKHSQHSIGYRFDTIDGKSITYSGDTDYCTEIINLAQCTDILILECSFPDDQKMEGHLTPILSATIAAEAACKHLILTHFYPACEQIDIKAKCKKIFPGKITLAHDMMRIKL